MTESLKISTLLPAAPSVVYDAWLSSQGHSQFTGSPAHIDPVVGGEFSAWDGYITGATLELKPVEKIVQSWRTTEFPTSSPNSLLTITFEDYNGGTRLILDHHEIPDGQAEDYRRGWEDYYFSPMKDFFAGQTGQA